MVIEKIIYILNNINMQTTILILIGAAMIITSIVNFAKPAYQEFVWKYEPTVNIALSFILWICSAFAVSPYLEFQLSTWALILIGLALWTGANIFYDIWKLIQNLWATKVPVEEEPEVKPSAIGFTSWEEDDE